MLTVCRGGSEGCVSGSTSWQDVWRWPGRNTGDDHLHGDQVDNVAAGGFFARYGRTPDE